MLRFSLHFCKSSKAPLNLLIGVKEYVKEQEHYDHFLNLCYFIFLLHLLNFLINL